MGKNKLSKKNFLQSDACTYLMVILAYLIVEIFVRSGHISSLMKGILVPLCTYSIMAVSLNLVVGISGELSLGHAGFMCLGAFSSALWSNLMEDKMPAGVSFLIAIFIGACVAAVFGFLIGIPVLRLKGDYLAIVTLAFGEIIKNLINALYFGIDSNGLHFSLKDSLSLGLEKGVKPIINGAQGITGTPKMSNFTIGVVLLLLTLFIVLNLIHSRTGRAIMAIRDNRIAAESIGLDVTKYKLLAFTISAAIAGVGGVLYAHNLSSLQALPKNFGYNQSIMILVFVVMGGIGNIRGSVISAVILTLLPEVLRSLNNYRMLMYSIVLIFMMLFTSAPAFIQYRQKLTQVFRKRKTDEDGKEEA
ncbi:MAG: branched-chain amino acid ABC transporter permease [Oribacterium sp.]|jgi:branched-chain amino acid transport system permease protein|nr:branched-chain amino acid ABC transporter permease [Oribacterium sp.]